MKKFFHFFFLCIMCVLFVVPKRRAEDLISVPKHSCDVSYKENLCVR